jgi:hypothetical protein
MLPLPIAAPTPINFGMRISDCELKDGRFLKSAFRIPKFAFRSVLARNITCANKRCQTFGRAKGCASLDSSGAEGYDVLFDKPNKLFGKVNNLLLTFTTRKVRIEAHAS